jgi:hypothetical protein
MKRDQAPGDEADETAPHEWCVIMSRSTRDAGVGSVTAPLIPNARHAAIIHLGRKEVNERRRAIRLPLLGSSKSEGMLVRELVSVIPYLDLKAPVHRNIWRQFGVPESGRLREAQGGETEIPSFRFQVDPPEAAVDSEGQGDGPSVFSWIQLDHYEGHHAAVESVRARGQVFSLRLRRGSESELVVLSRDLARVEQGRVATWFIEGQELPDPTIDLAAVDVLEKVTPDGQCWRPQSVMADGTHGVRIEGYRGSDSENEAYQPMWGGSATVPQDAIPIAVTRGFPNGVRWYHLRQREHRARAALCDVDWQLRGYFSEACSATRVDGVGFRYTASGSLLVLGEWAGGDEHVPEPCGIWNVNEEVEGREYWPELTAAVMSGLCECVQSAGRLGRVMAFRNHRHPGVAEIAILQLPDIAGTLEEVFRLIFNSEMLRRQFVSEARHVLASVESCESERACFAALGGAARQAIGAFDRVLDPSQAMRLLEGL